MDLAEESLSSSELWCSTSSSCRRHARTRGSILAKRLIYYSLKLNFTCANVVGKQLSPLEFLDGLPVLPENFREVHSGHQIEQGFYFGGQRTQIVRVFVVLLNLAVRNLICGVFVVFNEVWYCGALCNADESFSKLAEAHVHVPFRVNLVNLCHHGHCKFLGQLLRPKVIIEDTRICEDIHELGERHELGLAWTCKLTGELRVNLLECAQTMLHR